MSYGRELAAHGRAGRALSVIRSMPGRAVALVAAAVLAVGIVGMVPATADPGGTPNANASNHARGHVAVCGPADPNSARCHSQLLTIDGRVVTTASSPVPGSYGPADLQSAYSLPSSTAGSGQTVAIVDAYNDPFAETDMGV